MSLISSPLRYPGGKANLTEYIEKVIDTNGFVDRHFVEPFAGGAAVTLFLLQRGTISSATLVERDPLVYSFWKSVFNHTDELCDQIDQSEINVDTWNQLIPYRNIDLPVETLVPRLGFSALFFSRTNFSGILKAGPIGGQTQSGKYKIDCRFNKTRLIHDIRFLSLYRDRVDVRWGDGLAFLSNNADRLANANSFIYIDPPYYEKGKSLYRHYFTNEQHIELSNYLMAARYPWLLSYDNCVFINELYGPGSGNGLHARHLYFDYSVKKAKREAELLISNVEIPPTDRSNSLIV